MTVFRHASGAADVNYRIKKKKKKTQVTHSADVHSNATKLLLTKK